MPLLVNLRHLEAHEIKLKGELPVAELDLDLHDDMCRGEKPLHYDFTVEQMESGLLVQGKLRLPLQCECVRCLKSFEHTLELKPWTVLLPLEGEEKVSVKDDCVDLTPHIREDILLEFPQHPLCEADCRGLPKKTGKATKTSHAVDSEGKLSVWTELDKLKF